MRLERSFPSPATLTIVLISFLIASFFVAPFIQSEKLQTDWIVTVPGANETFQTGQAIDFHLFLADEFGEAIEKANVTATFDRAETVHQIKKNFHGLANGLYETEVVFSVPGRWIVMLDVQKGNNYYRNQYLLDIEGPIVAEGNRDPADHFDLEQPLPLDVKRELENIPVFKR